MSVLGLLGVAGLGSNLISNIANQSNFEDQMQYAKWQYKDMARRQDPVHQVNRLRAAGINPALAFGGIQSGQATASSQPSPTPMSPLDLSGLSSLGSGIDLNDLNARNVQSQTDKNNAETQGINVDNLFKHENWKSTIYNRDMQSWLNNQLSEVAKLDVQYNKDSLSYRVAQQRYQMQLLDSQVVAQDLANHYFPFEVSERISKLMSEQFANYATGRASLQMAHQNLMRLYAEVGSTPEKRKEFAQKTLDLLDSQRRKNDRVEGKFGLRLPFGAGVDLPTLYDYDKDKRSYVRNGVIR